MTNSVPASAKAVGFDLRNQSLLVDGREVVLRPKTFGVLCCLVDHAGKLVTKKELLDSVWPSCHVSEVVLAVSIRELRKILGDDPRNPQFIRTVHRRGYRWVGARPARAEGGGSS